MPCAEAACCCSLVGVYTTVALLGASLVIVAKSLSENKYTSKINKDGQATVFNFGKVWQEMRSYWRIKGAPLTYGLPKDQ